MINEFKIFLTRFRLARWVANLKNGTLRILRNGYHPRQFWDEWADRFAKHQYQRRLHPSNQWLLDRLRETRPEAVFELGCGFGRNLKMLQQGLGYACRLGGLDLSVKLLQRARPELGPDVPLVCGDVNRLPFRDRAFETVVIHGVLMHVQPEHIRSAMREVLRVTGKTLWCIEEQLPSRQDRGTSLNINDYTFAHDYLALLDERGICPARVDYEGTAIALILMRVDLGSPPLPA